MAFIPISNRKLIYRLQSGWNPKTVHIKKAGGQTNRNFIVTFEGKRFFVRLPWERTDIINRRAEAKNILALVKCKKIAKILPAYHIYVLRGKNIFMPQEKFNLPDGTMMIEYIEGKDITSNDFKKPKVQTLLLKALHLFHTSQVKFNNTYDVFQNEVLKYKKKAKEYPIQKVLPRYEIKKIEKIEKITKRNFPLSQPISTHNDLIWGNLRLGKNGKIYLLDFEYAGLNIRQGKYYDLGTILGENLFHAYPIRIEGFEEILKRAEKIYKNKLDRKKIYYGALINILVMFWWGLVKYFSSIKKEEEKYFKNYVLKRAKRIELLFKISTAK